MAREPRSAPPSASASASASKSESGPAPASNPTPDSGPAPAPDRTPGSASAPGLWHGEADGTLSEASILVLLDELFPSVSPHTPLGRGHDCAALASGSALLALSTDLFLEDEHFSRRYFTPEEAGAKALATAASDLAAAGAEPLGFSLGLILPPDARSLNLRALFSGMAALARNLGMVLSGGDLSAGPKLGLCLTVWGAALEGGAPFFRRGAARAGDMLFLVGRAGLARVGLWALEDQGRKALNAWPESVRAHLEAVPLIAQGRALALFAREAARKARQKGLPAPEFSLMDLSDGLAADVPRLLAPLGVDLDFGPDLVPEEVRRAAPLLGQSAEDIFLQGGEDYALLGSCPAGLWPDLQKALPEARPLGRVRALPGISLHGKEIRLRGFDHFCPADQAVCKGLPPAATIGPGDGPGADANAGPDILPAFARQAASVVIRTGREAWRAGLMAGFNGNLSCLVDLPDGGRACLITRSGAAKARLEQEDFCLLNLADGALLAGAAPSSESPVHLGIYRACPHSRAVLHVHPPELLAASLRFAEDTCLNLPLPEAQTYSARLAWTPFFPPGSAELGEAVAKAAMARPAVWMERHGLVTHGPDMAFALSLAEELEQLATIRLRLAMARGS